MKFSEYIKEEKTLIGMKIGAEVITPEFPNERWIGDFQCSDKKLTSLKGAPKEVTGYFYCGINLLTSLKHAPKKVGKDFWCNDNGLTSLDSVIDEIGAGFYCHNNKLTHLKDVHKIIKRMGTGDSGAGVFYCTKNEIKSHVLGLLLIPGFSHTISGKMWGEILNKYVGKGHKGMLDCQNELIEAGYEEFAQI